MNLNFELLNFKFELANLRTFLKLRTSPYRFPPIFKKCCILEKSRKNLANIWPKFSKNSAKFSKTSPFRDRVAELRGPIEGLAGTSCELSKCTAGPSRTNKIVKKRVLCYYLSPPPATKERKGMGRRTFRNISIEFIPEMEIEFI